MGSTRLPGKVMMPLGGRLAIDHVVERAQKIPGVNHTVVATSTRPIDDALAQHCATALGVEVYRGSESDVLDRYYQAAVGHNPEAVVRITADCPLLDPRESGKVLAAFAATSQCDYASNVEVRRYPIGLDTEVVAMAALAMMWKTAVDAYDREHVTEFIVRQPGRFRTASVLADTDLGAQRWTLDRPDDYEFLAGIFAALGQAGKFGYLGEVLDLLRSNPGLARRDQPATH